jgi:hypothetical protein
LDVQLPINSQPWHIGLITGPSASRSATGAASYAPVQAKTREWAKVNFASLSPSVRRVYDGGSRNAFNNFGVINRQ